MSSRCATPGNGIVTHRAKDKERQTTVSGEAFTTGAPFFAQIAIDVEEFDHIALIGFALKTIAVNIGEMGAEPDRAFFNRAANGIQATNLDRIGVDQAVVWLKGGAVPCRTLFIILR